MPTTITNPNAQSFWSYIYWDRVKSYISCCDGATVQYLDGTVVKLSQPRQPSAGHPIQTFMV